jgi:hypothetical protein
MARWSTADRYSAGVNGHGRRKWWTRQLSRPSFAPTGGVSDGFDLQENKMNQSLFISYFFFGLALLTTWFASVTKEDRWYYRVIAVAGLFALLSIAIKP